MSSKANKLLERMRQSKQGWRPHDLVTLYEGFGFIVTHGANHDIIKHPTYLQLRTTLPRHKAINQAYIELAIKLIDTLLALQAEETDEPRSDS